MKDWTRIFPQVSLSGQFSGMIVEVGLLLIEMCCYSNLFGVNFVLIGLICTLGANTWIIVGVGVLLGFSILIGGCIFGKFHGLQFVIISWFVVARHLSGNGGMLHVKGLGVVS